MAQDRTRKIVIAGVLGAMTVVLGLTRWGFIPWVSGYSLTIIPAVVVIGAVLEGPMVGLAIGIVFGLFSMIQAAIPPILPGDAPFTNPLISVLPRVFIGPAAYGVYALLKRWPALALSAAGLTGTLTNTVLVLGMLVVLRIIPLAVVGTVLVLNAIPEMIVAAIMTLAVVSAVRGIKLGRRQGADL